MPPKPVESLNDPNATPAFRSFWQAQAGPGHTPDPYEYQGAPPGGAANDPHRNDHGHSHNGGDHDGHSHAHGGGGADDHGHQHGSRSGQSSGARESTPLLATSSSSSSSSRASHDDGRIFGLFRSYASLCYCLIPLLLLLLLLGYFFYHHYHSSPTTPPPLIIHGGGGGSSSSPSIAAFCNPFALTPTSVDIVHHHGLVASLYLLPPTLTSHATTSSYYLSHTLSSNSTFFFSDLDTPTRLFTRLLHAHNLTSGADVLMPSQYFLLSFHTVLSPPPSSTVNTTAQYQLALISDDGSSLYSTDLPDSPSPSSSSPPSSARLIDNDGVHTTRMATSAALSLSTPLNLTLHYFQGPPAHVALQMLYRRGWGGGGGGGGGGGKEGGKG